MGEGCKGEQIINGSRVKYEKIVKERRLYMEEE